MEKPNKQLLSQKYPFILNIVLCVLLASYYFWFANKGGLVLGDEGYSLHNAERILQGQMPYRDFFLQYPPGYFYLIAACFKIFGISMITGRFLTLTICLGIFISSLILLKMFNITSWKMKVSALLCIAAFGYPHINLPLVVWPSVLLTMLLMIEVVKLFQKSSMKTIVIIGAILAIQFFIKQNVALVDVVLVNILLTFATWERFAKKIESFFAINAVWFIPTIIWVYYFFLQNNLPVLIDFLTFNQRYIGIYPFSYPPLSFLLQPLGFFKLLPYYLPILFLVVLIFTIVRKKTDRKFLVFLLPLTGFFTTIYPTSDLLHVYPYLGPVLLSIVAFFSLTRLKFQKIAYILVALCVISGFYLTFFKGYYLGQPLYKFQNTPIIATKAKGLEIANLDAQNFNAVYTFINSHTKPHEYIFAYSFAPMLYFLLDRPNPSRYSIYYPMYLTAQEEEAIIHDIQKKKVRYVIVDWAGLYNGHTPLSAWLLKKKKILLHNSQYTIIDLHP